MNEYSNIFSCPKIYEWISAYIHTGEMAWMQILIILESHFFYIFVLITGCESPQVISLAKSKCHFFPGNFFKNIKLSYDLTDCYNVANYLRIVWVWQILFLFLFACFEIYELFLFLFMEILAPQIYSYSYSWEKLLFADHWSAPAACAAGLFIMW